MTETKSPGPTVINAGARINVGPWMQQFAITGTVACTAEDCPGWSHTFVPGEHALDFWHAIQLHMLDVHLNLTPADFKPIAASPQTSADAIKDALAAFEADATV